MTRPRGVNPWLDIVAAQLAARVLAEGLPPDVLLNVNHPRDWNGECRLTRQGRRSPEPMTDHEALATGYVSICPLQINRSFLVEDSSWLLDFGELAVRGTNNG